ncbi:MAG: thioredoxin family protein [Planctomycetota bacterium]|nr:thioredoxin family protein [Planctomycetota bacterium]
MNLRLLAVSSLLFCCWSPLLAQDVTPAAAPVRIGGVKKPTAQPEKPVYDVAADARLDVAAAIANARRENHRVLIQWGANWCGWCVKLAGAMRANADVARELKYEYDVVHVDVGKFDKNMDLAKELGADFKGIPYLTILDADGKALVQQDSEAFETKDEKGNGGHDGKLLLAFLTKNQAPTLDAAVVRLAAFARAKTEQKRVFIHFGAPWCSWCHRLENWLAQPEIAALIAKDFVAVKIDQDRMTGGEEMLAAELKKAGVKSGGIPWFTFLDLDGKQIITSTNAGGANTGFPNAISEVQHFGVMLKTARIHLTDADVKTLTDSLDAIRLADEAKKPAKAR